MFRRALTTLISTRLRPHLSLPPLSDNLRWPSTTIPTAPAPQPNTQKTNNPQKTYNHTDAKELDALFSAVFPKIVDWVDRDAKEPMSMEGKRAPLMTFLDPAQLRGAMSISLPEHGNKNPTHIANLVQDTLQYSVRTNSPRFWDKLYSDTDAIGQVGEFLTAVANNNMHTYACSPAFTLMELELISRMAQMAGFDPVSADGIFGPGGSYVNMVSMFVARHRKFPHVKTAGAFDPLHDIADIARKYRMHMHVDGCFGGSLLMSNKHKHKLDGVERADSFTWNPHKLLGIPMQCSAFLTKHKRVLQESSSLSADYLFHDHTNKAFDLGPKTLQCGRHVDALKFYLSWHWHGRAGYEAMINKYMDNAQHFAKLIKNDERFFLLREPESVNVCFFYLPKSLRKYAQTSTTGEQRIVSVDKKAYPALDKVTSTIYDRMLRAGNMMVNFNPLSDLGLPRFFRIVLSNPRTTHNDMRFVLAEIDRLGKDL